MPLVEKDDSRFICKYSIVNLTFTNKDNKEEQIKFDFPSIMSIEYVLNIENNLTSMIKISFKLDLNKKNWIIRNRRNLEVIFNLGMHKINQNNDESESSGELIFEGKYIPIFTESTTATDSTVSADAVDSEISDKTEELNEEVYSAGEEVMDVYLFKEKILKCSRVSCNYVFKKDTLQNIVGALLTRTGHEKVLMNKFQNEEEYIEMLIPENPLYRCLMYLDQYYGFYKAGAIIFYDNDQLYILDSSFKEPVGVEDEELNVTLLVDTQTNTSPIRGIVEKMDDDEHYIHISESEINATKASWINESDSGSKIYMNTVNPESDKENEEKNVLLESEIEHIGTKRMKRYHNIDHENKYAKESFDARLNENESVLYVNAQNVNLNFLKPNKLFKVIFDNPRKKIVHAQCKYRLAMAHSFLSIEDNSYFTSSHRFILKKCGGEIHNEDKDD